MLDESVSMELPSVEFDDELKLKLVSTDRCFPINEDNLIPPPIALVSWFESTVRFELYVAALSIEVLATVRFIPVERPSDPDALASIANFLEKLLS